MCFGLSLKIALFISFNLVGSTARCSLSLLLSSVSYATCALCHSEPSSSGSVRSGGMKSIFGSITSSRVWSHDAGSFSAGASAAGASAAGASAAGAVAAGAAGSGMSKISRSSVWIGAPVLTTCR